MRIYVSTRFVCLLILVLVFTAATALAQVCPNLAYFTVPNIVRGGSLADLQADVLALCTSPGSASTVTANVDLFLNVNVTNRINYGLGAAVTDAVMVINEQIATPPTAAFVAGSPTLGTQVNDNQLHWTAVDLPIPAAGMLTIRFTNIRGNVHQLGFPLPEPPGTARVQAFVSFTSNVLIPSSDAIDVGVPLPGLNTTLSPGGSTESLIIGLAENFANAFKVLGLPAVLPGFAPVEDGYPTPGSGANGGGASQGTRVLIRITDAPGGIRLVVPTTVSGGTLKLARVAGTDSNGAGGIPLFGVLTPGLVTLSGGEGILVYEVETANPFAIENVSIPVSACHPPAGPPACPSPLGANKLKKMLVNVTYAPLSTVATSSSSAPLPRFADTGTPLSIP